MAVAADVHARRRSTASRSWTRRAASPWSTTRYGSGASDALTITQSTDLTPPPPGRPAALSRGPGAALQVCVPSTQQACHVVRDRAHPAPRRHHATLRAPVPLGGTRLQWQGNLATLPSARLARHTPYVLIRLLTFLAGYTHRARSRPRPRCSPTCTKRARRCASATCRPCATRSRWTTSTTPTSWRRSSAASRRSGPSFCVIPR